METRRCHADVRLAGALIGALAILGAAIPTRAATLEVSDDDGQNWYDYDTSRFDITQGDNPSVLFLMTSYQPYLVRCDGIISYIGLNLSGNAEGYVNVEITYASSVGVINLTGGPSAVATNVLSTDISGNLGSVYVHQKSNGDGGAVYLLDDYVAPGVGGNITGVISCSFPSIEVDGDLAYGASIVVQDVDEAVSGSIVFEGSIIGAVTVYDAIQSFNICADNLADVCSEEGLPQNINITPSNGEWKICGTDAPMALDSDCDGIPDDGGAGYCTGGQTQNCDDNCPNTENSDQADADTDGVGDVCEVVYVKQHAGGTTNGTSWSTAYIELFDALQYSRTGQEIWVAEGTYNPTTTSGRTYTFLLRDGIDVYGGFAGTESSRGDRDPFNNETILDGDLNNNDGVNFTNRSDNSYHVVAATSTSGDAILDGFHIRGGYADGTGGGATDIGGGILITDCDVSIVNCAIYDNYALAFGGGVEINVAPGSAMIACTIESNLAGQTNYPACGGGVDCYASDTTFLACRIRLNEVKGSVYSGGQYYYSWGGGVSCVSDPEILTPQTPTFQYCAISENGSAFFGGGISSDGRGIILRDSRITTNEATWYGGGGIWLVTDDEGDGAIEHCTFSDNEAGSAGGAMYVDGDETLIVRNSILWGNSAPLGSEILNDGAMSVNYSDVYGMTSGTNFSADPEFLDPDGEDADPDNDFYLTWESPCLNTGDPSFTPAQYETDIEGDPRVVYGRVDVGMDEYVASCNEPTVDVDGDGDVDLTDFGVFASCFNGPNRPHATANETCFCHDTESDGDVDLTDFGVFAACFNGPNRPPAGGCPSGGGLEMAGMSGGGGLLESVDVTFTLDSDQDQQTISAGTAVDWEAIVEVTGSNQGLASFAFGLELREGSATGPLAGITLGTGTWADSFAVAGPDGQPETGAAVTASGSAGGPGMNALSSTGYNAAPGLLEQVGAGYLNWDPWRLSGKSWTGNSTWGVGLDARKEALLLDALGSYSLATGTIDTTNLDPGDYVLRLVPAANIGVLNSGIDLNSPAAGSVSTPAGSVSEPVTIEFTIDEE
ncbi:MAG: hypothetical protein JXA69_01785 [Phycisphaerae bacterium]|nr:hypothetical protein [Phycisphaerae bacterium]